LRSGADAKRLQDDEKKKENFIVKQAKSIQKGMAKVSRHYAMKSMEAMRAHIGSNRREYVERHTEPNDVNYNKLSKNKIVL
jgi:hypothetical protein